MSFVINPGTIQPPLTAGGIAYGTGSSAKVSAAGTVGQVFTSNGSGVPTWSTINASPTITATASGSMVAGDAIMVQGDGTVAVVRPALNSGSPVQINAVNSSYLNGIAFDSVNNKVVVAFKDGTGAGVAAVGTVSGSTTTWGTPVQFSASITSTNAVGIAYDAQNQRVVIAYATGFYSIKAIVGTVSGTSISFGTEVTVAGGANDQAPTVVYDSNAKKVVIGYCNASDQGEAIVGTVSGTSISFGSPTVFHAVAVRYLTSTFDSSQNSVVFSYRNNSAGVSTLVAGQVSGTSISFGSTAAVGGGGGINATYNDVTFDSVSSKVIAVVDSGEASVCTVTGTSISSASPVTFQASGRYPNCVYDTSARQVVVTFRNNSTGFGTAIAGTVSGTTISFGSAVTFQSSSFAEHAAVYDPTNSRVVVAFSNANNSYRQAAQVLITLGLTATNFIGFSSASYSNGQTATINVVGSRQTGLSSIAPGSAYYVLNSNTLSTTAGSPSVYAGIGLTATSLLIKG